jgi:RNA polymerase sigma factor (sigma-70 family)
MEDIHTDPGFPGQCAYEFIFDEAVDYSAPKFRGQDNPNNLTTRRWREPILSAAEVADALRAAKGPEPAASAAKDKLAQSFHRLVLKEAKAYCGENQARNDDIIQAGMLGLAEAIDRFDLSSNNGFTAFALPYIRGRMKATAKRLGRNGLSGETRLQRLVHGNHEVTLDKASEVVGRPVDEGELEEARGQVLGMHSEPIEYNTREPGFEDDDEERKPGFVAVAPLSPLLKTYYDASLQKRPGSVEWFAEDTDRRARKRLAEIGRRAFALELVEREKARIAARADPSLYLYRTPTPPVKNPGPVAKRLGGGVARSRIAHLASYDVVDGVVQVTHAPAYIDNGRKSPKVERSAPYHDPKKHSNKRRPRIRVWRCNEPAALAA